MARILIVDDDELFIKLMAHTLKQSGHEIEVALDGLAGTRAFAASHFDVVICDIFMPEQEGIETIRLFRKARPDVGIIAISGGLKLEKAQGMDVLQIAGMLGATVTLKKPFKMSELNTEVARLISNNSISAKEALA